MVLTAKKTLNIEILIACFTIEIFSGTRNQILDGVGKILLPVTPYHLSKEIKILTPYCYDLGYNAASLPITSTFK